MLEKLRSSAQAGTFWKPSVGDEIVVKIGEEVEIGVGKAWKALDLVNNVDVYIPEYGNLLKKNLQQNKVYYINCSSVSRLTKGPGKGKDSRVFFVKELSKDELAQVLKDIKESSDSEKVPF